MFIDPRGPRFGAALTTAVLAVVLITGNAWLLAAQAGVFALGALGRSPYALLFRRLVRPRLGPPAALEHDGPPRFAQVVGLGFAVLGLAGLVAGSTLLALVAVGAEAPAGHRLVTSPRLAQRTAHTLGIGGSRMQCQPPHGCSGTAPIEHSSRQIRTV